MPTWVTGKLGQLDATKIGERVMDRKLDKIQSNVIFFCFFLAS